MWSRFPIFKQNLIHLFWEIYIFFFSLCTMLNMQGQNGAELVHYRLDVLGIVLERPFYDIKFLTDHLFY